VNLGGKGTLVRNVSTNTGHWIAIKLVGTKSNRDGWARGLKCSPAASGTRRNASPDRATCRRTTADCILDWRGGDGRQADCALAERTRADAGKRTADRVLTVEEPK